MKLEFSDKSRKIVFFLILVMITVSLIIVNNVSNKQDKAFSEDNAQYRHALQLLSEGKADEAAQFLTSLVEEYPDNPELVWKYATLLSQKKDYEKAQTLFHKAQDKNLFLIRDPLFLAQYGEVLYRNGDYQKAKVYLQETLNQYPNEELSKLVNSMLTEIQKLENQQ